MSEDIPPYKPTVTTVRLPGTLRKQLESSIESSGISGRTLTDEIVERLEESFAPSRFVTTVLQNLEMPRVVRLVGITNTDDDTERLLRVFAAMKIERCIFAARADDLNGAVMVLFAEAVGQQLGLVLDHSYINMARRPRMSNVQTLMSGLGALGVLESAEYCPTLLSDTRDLTAEEAAARIVASGVKAFEAAEYLRLLAQHEAFRVSDFVAESTGRTPRDKS